MPFSTTCAPKGRVSCPEFALLIASHLWELESHPEVRPNHRALLAVLRQQLTEQQPQLSTAAASGLAC